MAYTTTVKLPFSLSKSTLNLYDFLKEVYSKIEEKEDKELIAMMLEVEKDSEISSNEILTFIDKRLDEDSR